MARLGLSDKVTIKLQDYRDETGVYDGIASIEMFEAVGEKYWPTYFNTVLKRLRPGRNATLQIITVADNRFETYRKSVDFIQKHIFPGGMLPSPSVLRKRRACGWPIPSNSAKAIRPRCGAGTKPSTSAGPKWRAWALTTASAGCGTCI